MDGLSCEFYDKVWDLIGPDYRSVAQEEYETGQMPLSWHRATLALIPKEEDLRDMRTYHPVSLLCLDFKIKKKNVVKSSSSCFVKMIIP